MDIKPNILATLAYYDVFDWPLKTDEILSKMVKLGHLNIPDTASPEDLRCQLDQLVLNRVIDCREGYYFLLDREYLVPLRLKREKIAKRKWRLAWRAVWWLRFVPYVRAVFASGSLAMNNTDELSDLDVLIVVKHGRIWLARFLILGVLSLLGMRRKAGDKIAPDKICPNHFITDRALSIPFKSIYTAQTYTNLAPIYTSSRTLIEEFKKANSWVLDYVTSWNFDSVEASVEVKPQQLWKMKITRGALDKGRPWQGRPLYAKLVEWMLDNSGLGRILENWSRRYQSRRIARNPANQSHAGHVVFDDEQLAFHPNSIETEVIKNYNERLTKLGLSQTMSPPSK